MLEFCEHRFIFSKINQHLDIKINLVYSYTKINNVQMATTLGDFFSNLLNENLIGNEIPL